MMRVTFWRGGSRSNLPEKMGKCHHWGKEKRDISCLVADSEGGKVKEEEKGFEEEERDGADIEALRECERV